MTQPLRPAAGPSAGLRLAVIALAAGLTAAAPAQQGGPPPEVSVARPVVKNITEWDEFTGRFVAKQRIEVRARVSGYLESVHFDEGQMVDKGQLLFVVDRRPFEADVARARAELARAAAQLEVAQREYERGQRLGSSSAMAKETVEERLAMRDAAQAEVEAAQALLRTAQLSLDFTEVRAPISGRSSDIRVDVGNLISGGEADSTVLTSIVSLDPIELEFEGSEAEFLRYTRLSQAGTRPSSRDVANPVQARLLDEKEWPHKGNMTFVDNQLDYGTGTIRARATFPNEDHVLLPGMFARLRLYGAGSHEAVLIPDEAVTADQAIKVVMVVDADNIVEPRPVQLGPLIDGLRVVREGLAADERIVVNGIQRARPGAPVTPVEVSIQAADSE